VLGIAGHPGAFAEFLTLPDTNLHVVPDSVPDEFAVFVEPLAAAGEILDQVKIPAQSSIAVLGDGKLGLLIAQLLHANGLEVRMFGRHKQKLALAQAAGIQVERPRDVLPKAAFDYVVDATGSPDGLRQAAEMAKPRGTVIMKSTIHGEVKLNTAPLIVNEITLVGSRCGRFEPALRLLQKGKIRLNGMITASYSLGDAPQAMARAAEKGVLKVLLRP
jgi:alcohol dehydrogenase